MTGLPLTATGAIGLVAKATLVLSVALVLAWLARRGSAKTLHLLWTTTFAVLLALPVMSLLAPAWVLPILPARTTAIEHHLSDNPASAPSATANSPSADHPPHPVAPLPTRYLPSPPQADGSIPLSPGVGVFLIWALGCGAGLVSLGAAAFRFRKLVREATPIRDPDWIRSTDMLRHRARVPGDLRILSSARVSTPMTGGPLRHVILLPASAKSWTPGRREMVVSHELVHVRRRDALWRLVGGAVVALYWFHPLIWLASRLAAAARERSCDEEVLALGVRPSAYARHLFSLASEIAPGPPVLSLPVVQYPHLESRIMSILKVRRPRFSRVRTYAALAVVGVVGTVVACARPVRMDPAASPAPQAETERLPERPVENPAPPGHPAPASASPSTRTSAEPPATGPIAAAPAVPEALRSQEIECEPGRFIGIMETRESTTVRVSVDGMSLCMYTSGDIVMTGDGTAVASMDRGSRLVLQSQAQSLHRMAITSGPNGLEYEWSIDGRSQPFDDEARDWRDLMLTVLARSQEAWEVRAKEGSMRREIGAHKRHVASLRREIGSHRRHVASLRREIGSHRRHVASLHREIASHGRHIASLRREIGGHERRIAGLRRGMARMTSAGMEEALRATTRALERLDLGELDAVAQALAEESGEVRPRALGEDARQIVEDALRLREETQNEVVRQLTNAQVEIVRAEGELRSARQAIGEYDLDRQVGEIEQEIERYDLDGRIRDIETRIEQYDLDGKVRGIEGRIDQYDLDRRVRELETQIEVWDADRRAEAIERSIQGDIAALQRLIDASDWRC
ncbi:MAG: hypothetical protein F4X47_11915 [Gammaproteobacteria bacterium]|nr:hypothetical protein [Gammaproteobacteria bacterium]MYC53011.1 hypothetical protein [Gammaproteobacteria bacterium]